MYRGNCYAAIADINMGGHFSIEFVIVIRQNAVTAPGPVHGENTIILSHGTHIPWRGFNSKYYNYYRRILVHYILMKRNKKKIWKKKTKKFGDTTRAYRVGYNRENWPRVAYR